MLEKISSQGHSCKEKNLEYASVPTRLPGIFFYGKKLGYREIRLLNS